MERNQGDVFGSNNSGSINNLKQFKTINMHKGVILLLKASDTSDAKDKADEFMEDYGKGNVWDWYRIGGRWQNALAPKDKVDEFTKWVNEKYPITKGSYPVDKIENPQVRPVIQRKWEELGLKGKNPFYSSYGFELEDGEDCHNIVPLNLCQEVVVDWLLDIEKISDEAFEKMLEARKEEKEKGKGTTSAYYADKYSKIKYRDFSFECNVYDCEVGTSEKMPDDISGYFAVMIDMHN